MGAANVTFEDGPGSGMTRHPDRHMASIMRPTAENLVTLLKFKETRRYRLPITIPLFVLFDSIIPRRFQGSIGTVLLLLSRSRRTVPMLLQQNVYLLFFVVLSLGAPKFVVFAFCVFDKFIVITPLDNASFVKYHDVITKPTRR